MSCANNKPLHALCVCYVFVFDRKVEFIHINQTQHKVVWAGPAVRISGTTGNRLWNNVLEASAGKKEGGKGGVGRMGGVGFPFSSHCAKVRRPQASGRTGSRESLAAANVGQGSSSHLLVVLPLLQ